MVALSLIDGLGEETGWRGFALPRMLAGWDAVVSSLVLGVVWAAWHLPLFWTVGSPLHGTSPLDLFLRLPPTALIVTWVFQRSRGSALLAVLFHGAMSAFAAGAPDAGPVMPGAISLGLLWVVALALIPVIRAASAPRPVRSVEGVRPRRR